MYAKYGEKWLGDLLYDDLYDWLEFMWTDRREEPLGLICLGSRYVRAGYRAALTAAVAHQATALSLTASFVTTALANILTLWASKERVSR